MCTDLPTFRSLIASRLDVTVFNILRFYVVFVYNPSSTDHACYLTVHPSSSIYNRVIKKIHPVDMIYRVSLLEFALSHTACIMLAPDRAEA